jgi:exopolysaccharide biosynthesis WecB/TagA/CpsF family protein
MSRVAQTAVIGGLETLVASREDLADHMTHDALEARVWRARGCGLLPKLVFSSNGQAISMARRVPDFAQVMHEADIIHADGMSVVFGSRLTGKTLPERISTTDFFHDAAKRATNAGLSFYFLGGTEQESEAARATISRLYPALTIAGYRSGYFSPADEPAICDEIVAAGTDILWLGLGRPLQEEWAIRNRARLRGIGWVKTCGGLFSFLSGNEKRAPFWVQAIGMEWLWRLARNPVRLAPRYLTSNPHAFYRIIMDSDRPRSASRRYGRA